MSGWDVISLWKRHKWTWYVPFMKNDKAFHDNLPQFNKWISELMQADGRRGIRRSRAAVWAHSGATGFSCLFVLWQGAAAVFYTLKTVLLLMLNGQELKGYSSVCRPEQGHSELSHNIYERAENSTYRHSELGIRQPRQVCLLLLGQHLLTAPQHHHHHQLFTLEGLFIQEKRPVEFIRKYLAWCYYLVI